MKFSQKSGPAGSDADVAITGLRAPAQNTSSPEPGWGRWALLLILLLAGGIVAGLIPRLLHRKALVRENRQLAVLTVNVVSPVPGKASSAMTLPAEVRAVVEAPIYARASGFIKRWKIDIGARVNAGDLLADIDTPELDHELTGARAGLAQAEAARALAKTTAARWADLLKSSSVAEQENAEKQADLKLKEANVDAAVANAHRLEDLQSFAHIKAPFAGTITARLIDVGDLIGSGKELFRLADTRTLRVFVRVPQPATPGIAVGIDAELTVPEMPGRKFAAKVVRTAGAIDATSRTLLTELELDNSRSEILSGSYAQVSFSQLKQDLALVLPSNTLLFRSQGAQIGVVAQDGRVELHKVILGRDFGRTLEIISGVTASDRVIINPADSLVSGVTVRVAETSQTEKAE